MAHGEWKIQRSHIDLELRPWFDALSPSGMRKLIRAAAERFYYLTRGNIGWLNLARAKRWPPLSPRYAKQVKRSYATLYRTGKLKASIYMVATNNSAIIKATAPYADVHQDGGGNNIPERPYFPMYPNGRPTNFAIQRMVQAINEELAKMARAHPR